MARRISLHIGVNHVDPAHYKNWDGALNAAELDAQAMHRVAVSREFEAETLLTKSATAEAVISRIERAAKELEAGDVFFLTFAGHGGQVPDKNGDEGDLSDETWCLYDRALVDDELYSLWATFAKGVRVFVVSDSCHSGTASRSIWDETPDPVATREEAAAASPRYRALPRDVQAETYDAEKAVYDRIQKQLPSAEKAEIGATVLLISSCQDEQLSLDGFENGYFTEHFLIVWEDGAWKGPYRAFQEAIRAKMAETQQPNYTVVGTPNPDFEEETPLT
jgi:metacaspase-1